MLARLLPLPLLPVRTLMPPLTPRMDLCDDSCFMPDDDEETFLASDFARDAALMDEVRELSVLSLPDKPDPSLDYVEVVTALWCENARTVSNRTKAV